MRLVGLALALALGCILPWVLPWRLPLWAVLPIFPLIAFLTVGQRYLFAFFILGLAFGAWQTQRTDLHQLEPNESGMDVRVVGQVVGLPATDGQRVRFRLEVTAFDPLDGAPVPHPPRLLRLNWYYPQALAPGDEWQFTLRLRRPRGLANFQSFDYRRWLLAEGIDATGYVREARLLQPATGGGLTSWRQQVRERLASLSGLQHADLLAALGIGDRSGLDASQWQRYAASGVIHLMVISGLHVGFVALLGYYLGSLLLRPLALLHPRLTAQDGGWLVGVLCAGLYALCAGGSTPTLRAFTMIAVLGLARLLRVHLSVWTVLSLAFALVLVLQPTSILSTGLWMSFGAVLVLVAAFQGSSGRRWWIQLLRAQLALFFGFSAIPLAMGNAVPWVSPLVNLFAVPLVGFAIVPLDLAGVLLSDILPGLASYCWRAADFLLHCLESLLHQVVAWQLPRIYPGSDSPLIALATILAGILLVALPAALRLWPLLVLPLLVLVIPPQERPFLTLEVFDVGQGTAVLLSQPGYQLLYDTGPAFSESFNAGRDIIKPRLEARAVAHRQLIVSHGDRDHAGGTLPLLAAGLFDLPTLVGEPLEQAPRALPCVAGRNWEVEGVQYRLLHPPANFDGTNNNDASCVLLVQFADQRILLPGDISVATEYRLLRRADMPSDLTLLLVPHHGSQTSSSRRFVDALQPGYAVVSAGYGNAFGHPADEVVQRYLAVESRVLNTAQQGALQLRWEGPEDEVVMRSARERYWLWWQE